jgi:hypothetical protein
MSLWLALNGGKGPPGAWARNSWTSSNGVPYEYVAASTKVLGADQVTEFESQVRSMYDQIVRISVLRTPPPGANGYVLARRIHGA